MAVVRTSVRGNGPKLQIDVDTHDAATIVVPAGVLGPLTAARLRDVLLDCVAEQPAAVVLDVSRLYVEVPSYALGILDLVARTSAPWTGTQLRVVSDSRASRWLPARGRVGGPHVRAAATYVRVYLTMEAALTVDLASSRRRTHQVLPAVARSVPTSRRFIREICSRWGCVRVVDDAELIGSELVSNAVRHAGTESVIRLELRGQQLTVAVSDANPRPALLRRRGVTARYSGFGLNIVSCLACVGQTVATPSGKTVWAVLATGQPADRVHDAAALPVPDRRRVDPGPMTRLPLPSHVTVYAAGRWRRGWLVARSRDATGLLGLVQYNDDDGTEATQYVPADRITVADSWLTD